MARRTILIIDELPDHRDVLTRLLRAVGYDVLEAMPGTAAIETAQSAKPDLILATLSLPGQPGWETARLLAQNPMLTGIPILGATVFTTLLSWPRVRAIGCADFIDKPFDFDGIVQRVATLLHQSPPMLAA